MHCGSQDKSYLTLISGKVYTVQPIKCRPQKQDSQSEADNLQHFGAESMRELLLVQRQVLQFLQLISRKLKGPYSRYRELATGD